MRWEKREHRFRKTKTLEREKKPGYKILLDEEICKKSVNGKKEKYSFQQRR